MGYFFCLYAHAFATICKIASKKESRGALRGAPDIKLVLPDPASAGHYLNDNVMLLPPGRHAFAEKDNWDEQENCNHCRLALAALLSSSTSIAQTAHLTPKEPEPISESDIAYPYRLFETTNIWTFILLDTATGRAWQVQYGLDDKSQVRLVMNGSSLLPEGATKRRKWPVYSLFDKKYVQLLVLDHEDSRIWQLQWSLDSRIAA